MSIAVVGYAFTLTLPANEKWLLVCLADYADDWGDSIFPAFETLEEKSGMSRATLRRTFAKLLERGILHRVADSTPVSPAFFRILGVPEPKAPEKSSPQCPPVLRRAVIFAFGGRCEYCGQLGTKELGPDGKPWTVDRVVPGVRGGIYVADNVTLACRACNARKRTQPAPASIRTLADLRQGHQIDAPSSDSADEGGGVSLMPGTAQVEPPPAQVDASPASTWYPIRQVDPGTDPSTEPVQAGAAPRPSPETPATNVGVITKLVHETLDLCRADGPDLVELVKCRCATLRIAYDSRAVEKAIESADYQRVKAGRRPSSPHSAGAVAARRELEGRP